MKIAVIGATGATGKKVLERALELGHEVIAVVRRPEAIPPLEQLTVRQGDVFDVNSIVQAIAGTDVVITCIGPTSKNSKGSGISTGILSIMKANFSPGTVMSEGIPNIICACQRAGVKHLVMQSGLGLSDGKELTLINRWLISVNRRIFSKAIKDKAIAEHAVQKSSLSWVIVRPAGLSDATPSSKYTAGPSARVAMFQPLSYSDCADCLVRAATCEPTWVRKIINVGR
ncbi:NAD(P)-dependent oxidoreductase [Paenibacillus glycanilyticus]|uniref:NAD(P)-binding domain-containing protein n=1 Tax=Paenibacillus glycanilyticus TaxID=126569 RepID=A0ABQ6GFA6_9BACL|nr:NAD(P)H-binding protein [Paenibacillus glycanilyticus]GLX69649.1 hypothetical protein MU1_39940 [Paenibacillus glycanilyticus]